MPSPTPQSFAPSVGPPPPSSGAPSLLCSCVSERHAKADGGRGGAASHARPPHGTPPSAACRGSG
eukprot:4627285-Alexandrium_andersonii.AAC.1